jgi:hypothetical protein
MGSLCLTSPSPSYLTLVHAARKLQAILERVLWGCASSGSAAAHKEATLTPQPFAPSDPLFLLPTDPQHSYQRRHTHIIGGQAIDESSVNTVLQADVINPSVQ